MHIKKMPKFKIFITLYYARDKYFFLQKKKISSAEPEGNKDSHSTSIL